MGCCKVLHQSVIMTMKTQGNKPFFGVEIMMMCQKLKDIQAATQRWFYGDINIDSCHINEQLTTKK